MKILITGSAGLIGHAVRDALSATGITMVGCDLRAINSAEKFDFRDAKKLRAALTGCDGILHLAALSRVVWGEKYPNLCRDINVKGMHFLAKEVASAPSKPWIIYASSREIYGTPPSLPCVPDTPPNPENVYAQTKYMGEKIMAELRISGVRTAVVRFSNVFGWTGDYPDRVVPAFARAAASGDVLRVRGKDGIYDFTPLSDTVDAVVRMVQEVSSGANDLPPIDIVTGRGTSLLDIARMAQTSAGGKIVLEERELFYPAYFQGDPRLAEAILGWKSMTVLEQAVGQLVEEFRKIPKMDNFHESCSWITTVIQ